MKRVYLDYAATTPLDPQVQTAMLNFERKFFGNPNSTHFEGQKARALIDNARDKIAQFIRAKPQEVVFTSGATESNNQAVLGVVKRIQSSRKIKPHIITTKLEHLSIFNVVKDLEKRGLIEATFISPTKEGLISAKKIMNAVKNNTVLVSVIFVSNEIGSILPIREIAQLLREINKNRRHKILFHTDVAQAFKFYNCNVEKIGCDLMTMSAHKIYGPKGIGALYIKAGTKIDSLLLGGAQEYGKRSGTQNTTGIIGFAKAVELLGSLEKRQKESERLKKLRDLIINHFSKHPKVRLNGPRGDYRSCDNINFTFMGIDQDEFLTKLDLAGVAASTGSACVSGSHEPSHVIKALGFVTKKPAATLRLSLGKYTTFKEVQFCIQALDRIIAQHLNFRYSKTRS